MRCCVVGWIFPDFSKDNNSFTSFLALLNPEHEGTTIVRNVENYLPDKWTLLKTWIFSNVAKQISSSALLAFLTAQGVILFFRLATLFGVEDSKAPKDIPDERNYLPSKCVCSEQHCLWDTMPHTLTEIYKRFDSKRLFSFSQCFGANCSSTYSDLPALIMGANTKLEDITSRREHPSCSSPWEAL
jgi:hypothetical protein